MSTYSTNLKLELITTGTQAGTWGDTTNTNLGTLLEQAISGYELQACTGGTDVITIPDGATGVARNMYLQLTGTGGGSLIVPVNKKLYFIYNATSTAITVKVTGLTGVSVPAGRKTILVSNGTDIIDATNYVSSLTLGTALPVASGGTGSTTASTGTGGVVLATSPTLVTPALGTPTALVGTNITGTAAGLSIGGNAATATTAAGLSATLAVASGGTGVTTSTGSGSNVLSTSPTLVTPILGTPTSGNLANCTFPTLNQNTTGNAATATAAAGPTAAGTFLGNNQSYQDVTGSRSYSTQYTNSTSSPIFVSVYGGGNTTMNAYVNGVLVQQSVFTTGSTNTNTAFIVPAGNTYQVNLGSGGVPIRWTELR